MRESSEREPFRHRARLQVTLVGPWQQGNVQYTHEKGRVTRGNCFVTKLRRTNKPSPGRPFSNAGRSPNPRGREGGETGGREAREKNNSDSGGGGKDREALAAERQMAAADLAPRPGPFLTSPTLPTRLYKGCRYTLGRTFFGGIFHEKAS